jgi:hypothetical protein
MVLAHMALPFLLNIYKRELDCPNYDSPVMFQLCAAEKVNTDHHFSIQVYFKSGLQDTVISDGRQRSQLKRHLGMEGGDQSPSQSVQVKSEKSKLYLEVVITFFYF